MTKEQIKELSDKLWVRYAHEWDNEMDYENFNAAIAEAIEQARNQALDESAKLIRNAAQRAVDKEYHKTFALLLMLAGDIDKLKDTSDPSVYLTLINEGNIEQSSQPHTVSNARESYQYVVRRISESGESFTRKQVGLIESIAVAAEEMGYQRGMKQAGQPQWIAVSERLPERNGKACVKVLARVQNFNFKEETLVVYYGDWEYENTAEDGPDYIRGMGWWVEQRDSGEFDFIIYPDIKVTHWMSLPAAPQSA